MANRANGINLQAIARDTMLHWGFLVEPPRTALKELATLQEPDFDRLAAGGSASGSSPLGSSPIKDMSGLLWSSIDNDDSRDLDQLEYLEERDGTTRLYVAVANLTPFVARGSALDEAARYNTTSIYTGVRTFPMFPDRLSTDLTSLV